MEHLCRGENLRFLPYELSRHLYKMKNSTSQNSTALPRYQVIRQQLEQMIIESYTSGDKLPSEQMLAAMFSVNRHTVRHAVDVLVHEGLVERRHGVGVFVLEHAVAYPLESGTRFSANLELAGLKSTVTKLGLRLEPGSSGVAERLGLQSGAELCRLDVLRKANGNPISLSTHYFRPELTEVFGKSYVSGSLHGFMETHLGYRPVRVESRISSILPRGRDAQFLLMPRNHPVLRVKSLNVHPESSEPVEYVLSRFRADRVELNIQL